MHPNLSSSGYLYIQWHCAHLLFMYHMLFINLDVLCTSVTLPVAAESVSAAKLEELFVSEDVYDGFGYMVYHQASIL